MNSALVECKLSRGLGFRGQGDRSLALRVKEEGEELAVAELEEEEEEE